MAVWSSDQPPILFVAFGTRRTAVRWTKGNVASNNELGPLRFVPPGADVCLGFTTVC
jgi:hypothetical protein